MDTPWVLSLNTSELIFLASAEADSPHVWLKCISLPGLLRPKLERQSLSMPYMCRINLHRLGTGLHIKSCGVHMAYVSPGDDGDKMENEGEFYSCHSADASDDGGKKKVNEQSIYKV